MKNVITGVCHLVADPSEIREVGKNKNKVCTFRVCLSGDETADKCFIDVQVWDKTAEIASQYLVKGREIFLEGELRLQTWEKDGKRQQKYYISGRNFTFVGGKKNEGGSATPSSQTSSSNASEEADDDIPF